MPAPRNPSSSSSSSSSILTMMTWKRQTIRQPSRRRRHHNSTTTSTTTTRKRKRKTPRLLFYTALLIAIVSLSFILGSGRLDDIWLHTTTTNSQAFSSQAFSSRFMTSRNDAAMMQQRGQIKSKTSSSSPPIVVGDPSQYQVHKAAMSWDPFFNDDDEDNHENTPGDHPAPPPVKDHPAVWWSPPPTKPRSRLWRRHHQNDSSSMAVWHRLQQLQLEYRQRYGATYGRHLLTRAVTLVEHRDPKDHQDKDNNDQNNNNNNHNNNNIDSWIHALATLPRLDILIAGNGAAAGYGNHRAQAYSSVLQTLLQRLTGQDDKNGGKYDAKNDKDNKNDNQNQDTTNTISVTNWAIDQSSEFPTAYCLNNNNHDNQNNNHNNNNNNNLQDAVVVWDYVGSTPERFEAFLRHVLQQGARVLMGRQGTPPSTTTTTTVPLEREFVQVLQHYCPQRDGTSSTKRFDACLWISDVATLGQPYPVLYQRLQHPQQQQQQQAAPLPQDDVIPIGLQDWSTHFGSHRGAPAIHHELDHDAHQKQYLLSIPQHEFVAWCILMPMLSALQHYLKDHASLSLSSSGRMETSQGLPLPPPVRLQNLPLPKNHLLMANQDKISACFTTHEYALKDERLRTVTAPNSLPASNGLPRLVASPIEGKPADLLRPKHPQGAWIWDLDAGHKHDKRQFQHDVLQRQDAHRFSGQSSTTTSAAFLGMPDWKTAYYGTFASGSLVMNLPVAKDNQNARKGLLGFTTKSNQNHETTRAADLVHAVIFCQADTPLPTKNAVACSWRNDVEIRLGGIVANETTPLDPTYSLVVSTRGADAQALCRRVPVPGTARLTKDGALSVQVQVTNPRIQWHGNNYKKQQQHVQPCSLSHVLLEQRLDDDDDKHQQES